VAKPINNERRNSLVQYVLNQKKATVIELAEKFNVSTETIRKDLLYLDQNNILLKGHGVVSVTNSYLENEFAIKETENTAAKIQIAKRAAAQIPENCVIFLDSGTTALQLAKILNLRKDLIIVSNSALISQISATSNNQILIAGGELRKKSFSYVGHWALQSLQQIHIDIAFLSCSGFHSDGPSIHSYRELEIKQTVIENSHKTILIADTNKFNKESLYRYATFSAFDLFIPERQLSKQEKERFPHTLNILEDESSAAE